MSLITPLAMALTIGLHLFVKTVFKNSSRLNFIKRDPVKAFEWIAVKPLCLSCDTQHPYRFIVQHA